MKSVFRGVGWGWVRLRGGAAVSATVPERLADKCLPNVHRRTRKHANTLTHCEQLHQKLRFSKWNGANESYECRSGEMMGCLA